MSEQSRELLRAVKTFPSLVKYLRDELDWPIQSSDFVEEDWTFDYKPEELGLDAQTAKKIEEIKQLRPLVTNQPWGIFFIKFEPKRLPVVVLRRILSRLVIKKRASARHADQATWNMHDLLFISNYGQDDERQITFAHFAEAEDEASLPTLRVLGWDDADTALHIDHVHQELKIKLRWPNDESDLHRWQGEWASAFILRHREVITTSKALAIQLAELAKKIRRRARTVLDIETERGPLRRLFKAFQESLIHDLSEDDFCDMYSQTVTYGLFSAACSRTVPGAGTAVIADNLADMVPITNPFLKEMLAQFLTIGGRKGKIDFDELGIQDVVELLNSPDTHMEAILRDFGNRTRQEDPVIHFYELFLTEYDKKKKVQRGVFYTPQPVVSYIVRSVHELLQTEFGIEDGLASTITWREVTLKHEGAKIPEGVNPESPFVQILDPATGTATFLVEVIDVVYHTMNEKWKRHGLNELARVAAWNDYVPQHLLPRLHGYELMMAPYAIAHMKVGLKLGETQYRFGSAERVRIYLTNSLEPPHEFSGQLTLDAPALAHEAKAVNFIKRSQRFTVLIGNPPYSLMSANLGETQRLLIQPYRFVDGVKIQERGALQLEKNLQDDYVKFIRLAQLHCESADLSITGIITNHSYIDNPTLRGMRRSLMSTFSLIRVLDVHGNAKRKELCPLLEADKNIFDIQQGVAIGVFTRRSGVMNCKVWWGELWGGRQRKYNTLQTGSITELSGKLLNPASPLYLFIEQDEELKKEFDSGISLDEIFQSYSTGIATARDALTIHFAEPELRSVVEELSRLPTEAARNRFSLGPDTNDWKVALAQKDLKNTGLAKRHFLKILYRPFDRRWTYYTGQPRGFHCNPRRPVMQHLIKGNNVAICAAKGVEIGQGFSHIFVTNTLSDHHCVSLKEVNYILPLISLPFSETRNATARNLWDGSDLEHAEVNFSITFKQLLMKKLGLQNESYLKDSRQEMSARNIFHYIYAILFSPTYRKRYSELLRKQFARIPFPSNRELFSLLKKLGADLVALHLMESSKLDCFTTTFTGPSDVEVIKVSYADETVWVNQPQGYGFRRIPQRVWEFRIGGYPVCEKWLKDRRGRRLSKDDINHYQRIIVALSETIRLMEEIDAVIEKYGGWPSAFQTTQQTPGEATSQATLVLDTNPANNDDYQTIGEEIQAHAKVAESPGQTSGTDERATINDIAPEETMAVIREVFANSRSPDGMDRETALREIASALGFERLGPRIREALEGDLIAAVRRGILFNDEGRLRLDCTSIEHFPKDLLKQSIVSVIGNVWCDQEDAIRKAARYLGFRRAGHAIQEAFKSAINGAIRQGRLEREGTFLRKTS